VEAASPARTWLDELALARTAFVDAIRRGDRRAVAELYGDDARLVAPNTDPLRGRDDVEAFWGAGVDSGITSVELRPEDVELAGSVAWEVGAYVLRMDSPDRAPIVDGGRYLLIYRLDGERWLRTAEMFRPDPVTP
jgi:ketosteroid isomerase-like protein